MSRAPGYGSDLVVDLLRAVGIDYVALNPGATYRGLHDSLVNYGGNRAPELILTMHENPSLWRSIQDSGAKGLLTKSNVASELTPALQAIIAGQTYFH